MPATLNTASNALYASYDVLNSAGIPATWDYFLIIPRALTQAEIAEIYDSLMSTGRRSLKSLLPSGSISLGYAETGSNGVNAYNDADWAYGRREGAVGGNRRVLRWTAISVGNTKKITNPFGTENVLVGDLLYKKYLTDNKHSQIDMIYNGGNYLGCYVQQVDAQAITIKALTPYLIDTLNSYTNAAETSGYIGCYAEVSEDDAV